MMDKATKNNFKAQAHHLKPVIIIGAQGITEALLKETEIALEAHELIKIKVNADTKNDRKEMALSLCDSLQAHFIQLIGNTAIVYRKKTSNS